MLRLLFFVLITHCINTETIKKKEVEYSILLKAWKTVPNKKQKFVLTNHKKEVLDKGTVEWDLKNNIWLFQFKNYSFKIEPNKLTKYTKTRTSLYPPSGFSKILSKPIEEWGDMIPFDNEIQMDDKCYTEFKTNKSYVIIYFQIKPFKIISLTFGEKKENYIFYLYDEKEEENEEINSVVH